MDSISIIRKNFKNNYERRKTFIYIMEKRYMYTNNSNMLIKQTIDHNYKLYFYNSASINKPKL